MIPAARTPHPTTVWVGVDPGYDATGVVVRDSLAAGPAGLIAHAVRKREKSEAIVTGKAGVEVGPAWVAEVAALVREFIEHAHQLRPAATVCVAVEDLTAPLGTVKTKRRVDEETGAVTPARARLVSTRHLIGAGMALAGAWLAVAAAAAEDPWGVELVRVTPQKHGQHLLRLYPPSLVTATERRSGLNRPARHGADLNHARAAWDIAGNGPAARRTNAAITALEN